MAAQDDGGRNYITNSVILERLEQHSRILDRLEKKLDCVVDNQHAADVDRSEIRNQVKNNKQDIDSLSGRSNTIDALTALGAALALILGIFGVSK